MAKKELAPMNKGVYDLLLWIFSVMVDLFFREIHPRSSWKVPRKGPVIIVAAPHANQFVDPLILMRIIRMESRRRIVFLIAEKSMRVPVIGGLARAVGAVPVGRAMDSTKPAEGRIYLPDPVNNATLLRGVGTKFESSDFQVGGLVVLPSVNHGAASAEIQEILGPEEIRLKKPFKGAVAMVQLTGRDDTSQDGGSMNGVVKTGCAEGFEGTKFKVAPKVDQTQVYDAVFDKLSRGGCIGIFPEGGSHDRTELLPLKAGVAIMALGALAANPDCGLKIVPCGMNYFHAHKFRSRAVVEFGSPVEVPPELIDLYRTGERREAVAQLLEMIYNALVSVTVTSPDYDTLMLIQAVRRLYKPKGKKLPLPMIVELNRRLVKGYTHYKDDPRIINLKKSVLAYNKQLMQLNVRDHQLEYAEFSIPKVVFTLLYRLGKVLVLSAAVLPGLILFAPVFIAGKIISIRKSREALAASSVKIQARDVVATWKLLVGLVLAPILYTFYTVLLTWWTYRNRIQGYMPNWVPLWAVVIFGYIFFPAITFAALRFGEIGMDIVKSLRPLVLCLNPSSNNTFVKLRKRRADLAAEVTELINTLGPEMFPDFDSRRIIGLSESDRSEPGSPYPGRELGDHFTMSTDPPTPDGRSQSASIGGGSSFSGLLPRNESFKNLGSFGLFSSRPGTPKRSRSRASSSGGLTGSAGFSIKGFSTLDSKEAFEDVTRRITGAMRERGRKRTDEGRESWEHGSSGATTPLSEVLELGKKAM